MSSTPSGAVEVKQGLRAKIQCVAKGWPQSNIQWESTINRGEFNVTTTTSEQSQEYTVTSSFTLESPSANHDGKNVTCVVFPMYGQSIRRKFTLNYVSGKEKFSIRMMTKNINCA